MMRTGRKTLAAPGLPEPIIYGSYAPKWATVYALRSNGTTPVYVGDLAVSAKSGFESGTPLMPGQSFLLPPGEDLGALYIDATASGIGVSWTAQE